MGDLGSSGVDETAVTGQRVGNHAPSIKVKVASVAWSAFLVMAPSLAIMSLAAIANLGSDAFGAGYALAVTLSFAVLFVLRQKPVLISASLLIWLSLQRFALATFSPTLDAEQLRALLAFKELFFPMLGVILLPHLIDRVRKGKGWIRAVDLLALAFGALVVVGLLLSPAPVDDRILYARRLAVLPLVYVAARLLPWHRLSFQVVLMMVTIAGVLLSVFGIAERFWLEGPLWREMVPAAYYYHLSGLAGLTAPGTDFPVDGLPRVFYDFTTSNPERRLVSTFLEATTLASFLAISALITVSAHRLTPRVLVVAGTIAAATFLTLSKAGIAVLLFGMAYLIGARLLRRLRDPAWMLSMAVGLAGALLVVATALQTSGVRTGALRHFQGLVQGIESAAVNPLGLGLGVGGGFGEGLLGSESTFGVLLVQLGVPGLAIWTLWVVCLAYVCAQYGRGDAASRLTGPAIGVALIGFFGTASLTESAGGLVGNWIYAFAAGALITSESEAPASR
jgi:hypothetical protein